MCQSFCSRGAGRGFLDQVTLLLAPPPRTGPGLGRRGLGVGTLTSCTKMPTLSTLCVTGKLVWCFMGDRTKTALLPIRFITFSVFVPVILVFIVLSGIVDEIRSDIQRSRFFVHELHRNPTQECMDNNSTS